MISSHGQRRIFLLPGRPDQSRNPGLQDISTVIKQVQQSRPIVPTNPDRSCTYLGLRAHPDEQSVQLKPDLKLPQGGAAKGSSLDQHSKENCPPGGGGVKIKMTLESAEPKGKRLRWQIVKPMLGLAGKILFKAN